MVDLNDIAASLRTRWTTSRIFILTAELNREACILITQIYARMRDFPPLQAPSGSSRAAAQRQSWVFIGTLAHGS